MSGTVSPHLGKLDPSGIKNCGVSPPSEEDRAAHQQQAPRRLKNDSSGNTTMGTSPPLRACQTQEKDGNNERGWADRRHHPKLEWNSPEDGLRVRINQKGVAVTARQYTRQRDLCELV